MERKKTFRIDQGPLRVGAHPFEAL